jgi:hypothetical protein
MADFQHIDRLEQAARHQRGLDRRLGVAGQQGREAAELEPDHDGAVVDVALGKWRFGIRLRGIQDASRRSGPEIERLAGPEHRDPHTGHGRIGQQSLVRGIGEWNSRVE